MTATGTPQVPQQIKFRDCPEEVEVWDFIRHIVTRQDISTELWLQGMEKYRAFVVKIIFPKITLVPIKEQLWFKELQPEAEGIPGLYSEQAFFNIEESYTKMWGLTRRGKWILGEGSVHGKLVLLQVSCEDILRRYRMHPAEIATRIIDFVRGEIMERRRRLNELEAYSNSADTFAGIASLKPNPSVDPAVQA